MSEIKKYKKYLNFKANPRYLTRDFIVPLYTGTEPDILDDSDTQRESSVYKEFPNEMPIVSPKEIQKQFYEQLQLADGGRANFSEGSKLTGTDKTLEQNIKSDHKAFNDYRKSIGSPTIPLDNEYIRMWIRTRLNKGGRVEFKDGSKPTRSTIYKITKDNHPEKGKYAYHGFNMKTKYFDTKKEAEDFKKFRLQNKTEQQTIKITDDFIQEVEKRIKAGKNKVQIATELKVPFKRINKAIEQGNIKLLGSVTQNPEYRSFVKKNYKDKTIETIAKELFTDKKIPLSTKKSRVNTIVSSLIADKELESVPAGLKSEIRDRYGFGKSSLYEIQKKTRGERKGFTEKTSSPETEYQIRQLKKGEGPQLAHRLGLEESAKLGQQYDIGNLGIDPPKINQEIAKSFENIRDGLVVERDAIAKKIKKNPSLELRKQLLNVNEKIKQVVDASDGRIQAFVLDEQTLEPIKYLGIKPRELAYGVIDETVKNFDLKEINKILRDASKTGKTTPENWEKIKKYQMFVANLQNEVDVSKKENIGETIKKLENMIGGMGCPTYAIGGRVNFSGGSNCFNKGLKALEEGKLTKEQLNVASRVIAESGEEASVLKNILDKAGTGFKFTGKTGKQILNFGEEGLAFGKGVAGRTLGPLTILNSALEQFTAGNYREAYRQAFDFLDPLPLIGIDVFEKYRREGSIENIRSRIGKENQESFNRILEFKPEFDKLMDVNTKLERAESAAQNPYDAESPGVDPMYINDLKKQQADLNKIVNSSKYQNIRNDIENVGKALQKETYSRNLGKPEQEKVAYDTANLETFSRVIGSDFLNQLPDETKTFTPNLTAAEKIREKERELPPMSDEQRIIIEEMGARGGAADGGRIGLSGGGGPKIGRRGFLGLIAGAAAAPDLIKAIKGTGQAGKIASKIKLEKAEGMYPWFPDLVEKIKTKGKPFEEKEIIMEASYKHEPKGYGGLPKGEETVTRHVDGDTEFLLREYPDGRIAVDIHSPRNQEGSSTPVTLYYRPTMELKYYDGVKVEPAEFKVLEKEPRYFANGPDDVDIEMSEMRKVPGQHTIFGDVEAAERFATGKIENRKIIPAKQARREQMEDAPTDFIEETSPYGPDTF
jgi:hypothetical protein